VLANPPGGGGEEKGKDSSITKRACPTRTGRPANPSVCEGGKEGLIVGRKEQLWQAKTGGEARKNLIARGERKGTQALREGGRVPDKKGSMPCARSRRKRKKARM